MVDSTQVAPESETPVNPYSLLEAVNQSSDKAQGAWLIFLAVMTYVTVAVAGVTHEALLLDTPVQLPILQVNIQLKQFFQFAPIVLVLFHLGVLAQLVLLARKTLEFDHAIQLLEATKKRTHPLRLELHNYFFVQAIAGPQRSRIMSTFLHLMTWLTVVVIPVVLLLYIQVVFLPYHDVVTTWINRVSLVSDIALLILIGVFLMRPETSFFQAFWRATANHPLSTFITTLVLILVAYLSFFAATVPGEALDKTGRDLMAWAGDEKGARADGGFALPFLAASNDESLFGVFHRNLVVADADLVDESDVNEDEKTLKLRGRDLRRAKLDRSDLRGADLTGARLDGASLIGTNLRNAWLTCAEIDLLVDTLEDKIDRIAARCTSARNANFKGAKLDGAHMSGIDMQGAKIEEARLEGADLSNSSLVDTDFTGAHLDKADLSGSAGQGANFLGAELRGANLSGAKLQAADFSGAAMQGAVLNFAHLQGTRLQNANLAAASLRRAKLHGADMKEMSIVGADLRGVGIWNTVPPAWDASGLADLSEFTIEPLDDDEKSTLNDVINEISDEEVRVRMREKLAGVLDDGESTKWKGSEHERAWQSWVGMSPLQPADTYPADLTAYLTELMCSARWADGSVATGVARRATEPQFRGDLVAVYDGLRSSNCPASKTTPAPLMRHLADKAEQERGR